jgi:hypothetical protein
MVQLILFACPLCKRNQIESWLRSLRHLFLAENLDILISVRLYLNGDYKLAITF